MPGPSPAVPPPTPPRWMRIDQTGGTWSARWRWFGPSYLAAAAFAAVWAGGIVSLLRRWGPPHGPPPWGGFVFVWTLLGLFALIALALSYTALAGFLNGTTVEVFGRTLTVRHGPLPWPGNREIDARDLAHVRCDWLSHRTPNGSAGPTPALTAVGTDGRRRRLVVGLPDGEAALYLKGEIERRLGLPPGPVGGR